MQTSSNKNNEKILIDGIPYFDENTCRIMAGPCAVESRDQILFTAEGLAKMGITIFRAGTFKPRTDPKTYQGARELGLKWLEEVRDEFGMKIITETSDMTNFDAVEKSTDIIQIGAKSMYNTALLSAAGKSDKPVMLKRHFGATVAEFLKLSEYIVQEGNSKIMLCERGIRTFETSTRFTLDLCGAAVIQEKTKYPLIIDPSHSMGYSYGVPKIAKAAVAFGCNGLLIEVHHNPSEARCDKEQAIDLEQFKQIYQQLKQIGEVVGKRVI
ncbi:MAG: 3-deoxy-7-phosphoheptulonate synthase [Oscillospiraceae bacterium]